MAPNSLSQLALEEATGLEPNLILGEAPIAAGAHLGMAQAESDRNVASRGGVRLAVAAAIEVAMPLVAGRCVEQGGVEQRGE